MSLIFFLKSGSQSHIHTIRRAHKFTFTGMKKINICVPAVCQTDNAKLEDGESFSP